MKSSRQALEKLEPQCFPHAADVDGLISALKPNGIMGCFYVRIYKDGTFINLSSQVDWAIHYFSKALNNEYAERDLSVQLFSPHQVSLWAFDKDNEVWEDAKTFGYGNGISFFNKYPEFDELMGFYGTSDNTAMTQFYVDHLDNLEAFKKDFICQSDSWIKRAEKEKTLSLPIIHQQAETHFLNWDMIFKTPLYYWDALLKQRKYLIAIEHIFIQLTKMEIRVIIEMLKGQHAGEIADALMIKQSTVESYIVNIKNKFGISQRSELIRCVIESNVLQQIPLD